MSADFDLIVIGGGSAGVSAAPFAARLGLKVALVERDRPGGDCTFTGCVPSKTLIKVARVAWEMRQAVEYGLEPHAPSVDLGRVMDHVQAVIGRVYEHERPETLAAMGIEVVQAEARFLDPYTVRAGTCTLRGRKVLLCSGARAARPPIPGLAETPHLTYETVWQHRVLPRRLLVLGAGPIGLELAQAFARLGSQVTCFQRGERILKMADPDASRVLLDALVSEGVRVRTGARVERAEPSASGVALVVNGERHEGDALLVAAGRTPNVAGLDLERAGVLYDEHGVPVDDHLRTSQKHIYACGDVVGSHQFTHYAGWQAYVAVRNAFFPGADRGVRESVPWTIFTDPEVARVGLTEPEARERHGDDVDVTLWPLERVDRAQTDGDLRGLIKVVHRRRGELLGAHVVAARAGEMIHEYVLAMEHGLRFGDLAGAIHVYPTYSTGNQQAAAAWRVGSLLEGRTGGLVRGIARFAR